MRILVIVAALIGTFGAGFAVGRYRATASSQAALPVATRSTVGKPAPLAVGEIAKGGAAPSDSPDAASSSQSYAALRAAVTVATKLPSLQYRVPAFMGERLNPHFVTLYELTPEEVARIDTALLRARERVGRLEAAKAVIAPHPDGSVRISVEPFPAEGGMVLDGVKSELLATLGPTRSDCFRALSDFDGTDSTEFGGFGLSRTVIEIRSSGPTGQGSLTSSTSFDPETKLQIRSMQTDATALKQDRPFLYKRLEKAGLAR